MAKKTVLSKTRLVEGIQCPKQLWLALHRKELIPPVDAATQAQFDEGHEVGALAREHFGPGYLVDTKPWEYSESVAMTQQALERGEKVLYEASFMHHGFYARVDILARGERGWDIIEVKKSNDVKEYQLIDATIQAWILREAGVKINSVQIMHLNRECTFPNLEDLFMTADITEQVFDGMATIEEDIMALAKVATQTKEPERKIGPHCTAPFECKFKDHCWKDVPAGSVFELPYHQGLDKHELFRRGSILIADLEPAEFTGVVRRAIEVVQSGKPYVNRKKIAAELEKWIFPLYFFDFETVAPAIPWYDGTSPYNQVPFQFSCHIWRNPADSNEDLDHFEYLHQSNTDPRHGLIAAMKKGFGDKGSIVSFNQSFEIRAIKALAEFDPQNRDWLLSLEERFVDPLPLMREHVYHPDFRGSFSMKAVAPALLGAKASYADMEIGGGEMAAYHGKRLLRGAIDPSETERIVQALLAYCRMDTLAMVELVRWLRAEDS